MADSLAVDEAKLEWAARLSATLLNDGTDAMRWYLLQHLPCQRDEKASISQIIIKNKDLLQDLRDGREVKQFLNHEMFDILFREDGKKVEEGDMEISLLFVLIRFLCKIKHPAWKLWDEEPQKHQVSPLFDIIRLVRFKERMKEIVCNYEITEDSFKAAWTYLTSLLDRLMCYKISARRWLDDVIKSNQNFREACRNLVQVMIWQTKSLAERDEVYLVLKNNRILKTAEGKHRMESCSEFLSQFGQQQRYKLSALNTSKVSLTTDPRLYETAVIENYRQRLPSPALLLNKSCEGEADRRPSLQTLSEVVEKKENLTKEEKTRFPVPDEIKILNRIDNSVFIEDLHETEEMEYMRTLRKLLKKMYITHSENVIPFPPERRITIPMDKINSNVAFVHSNNQVYDKACNMTSKSEYLQKGDVLPTTPEFTVLPSWRKMFDNASPTDALNIMLSGEHSSGKTILLRKIAYEWATKNHVSLSAYRFVFYVDLALVPSDKPYTRLSDCILQQCVFSDISTISSDEIEDIFTESDGAGILLLLDGIERLLDVKKDEMAEFFDVLRSQLWPKCSVVLTTSNLAQFGEANDPIRNLQLVLHLSSVVWQKYLISGFTQHEVERNANYYFSNVCPKPILFRQFIESVQVFQRDVSNAVTNSPMMIYMLCKVFLPCHADQEQNPLTRHRRFVQLPETLSEILRQLFYSTLKTLDGNSQDGDHNFSEEVLRRKLIEDSGNFYKASSFHSNHVTALTSAGILLKTETASMATDDSSLIYYSFPHVLFEDYFAAKIFTMKYDQCQKDMLELLRISITSLSKAIRLRHFLMFSCSFGDTTNNVITSFLSQLLRSESEDLNSAEIFDSYLHEATKLLILRCHYETNYLHTSMPKIQFPQADFLDVEILDNLKNVNKTYLEDHKWNSSFHAQSCRTDGCDLQLMHSRLLSSSSAQALASFTASCAPVLTQSGSVYPFFVPNQTKFWVRSLRLFGLQGEQLQFVSRILNYLPFLEEAYFPEVTDIKNEHISCLCRCFSSDSLPSLRMLHSLVLTAHVSSGFHPLGVTSYEELGQVLQYLPHLERLELTVISIKLFFSIFDQNTSSIAVPFTSVRLPHTDFDEQSCRCLAQVMNRLIFVQRIDLSRNPIYGGLLLIANELHELKDLQVLEAKEACLTCDSVIGLANAIRQPQIFQSLRHLDISENYLQNEKAMSTFVGSLKHLKVLQHLDLSRNYVGDNSACVLARSLEGHEKIRTLRLDCVQIGPVALSSLKYHLQDCRSLEILSMAENYFGPTALDFATIFQSRENGKIDENCGLPNLVELNLSGISDNLPVSSSSESVATFVNSINSHKRIKTVHLLHFDLHFADLIKLLDVCEKHQTVNLVMLLIQLEEDRSVVMIDLRRYDRAIKTFAFNGNNFKD